MEKWQKMYTMGWCNKEQLKIVVQRGKITQEQYEEIVGPDALN